MTDVVLSIPIGDGSDDRISVEATLDEQDEGVQLAAATGRAARLTYSLNSALQQVIPTLDTILSRVRESRLSPDEIALEFGLKIGGEHGIILTKGTAEANIKLTVKWRSGPATFPDEVEVEAG
ncbi:CU044_2847 family protein [Actinoplanes sp. NPDC049118]|uniref:CU044_2847 family protein n=1 Tax=Actinoplanes sp. NPDC049118 TaxID=3155769 RepID=UPI0033CC1CD6